MIFSTEQQAWSSLLKNGLSYGVSQFLPEADLLKLLYKEIDDADLRLPLQKSSLSDVISFFDEAAIDYDTDLTSPYWAFSHEILEHLISLHLKKTFPDARTLKVLDAGAGTGNWSNLLAKKIRSIDLTMFDINPNMLRIAHKKLSKISGCEFRIKEGNLLNLDQYEESFFDLIICFHNVIGLVRDTNVVLQQLAKRLKKDGLGLIMAPNKFHAALFMLEHGPREEFLNVLLNGTVRFKPQMPEMYCYTPTEFRTLLGNAGFEIINILGFPVSIFPELKDTDLKISGTTNQILNTPSLRSLALEREKIDCLNPSLAYRAGNSLIAVVAKKR